MSPEAAGLRSYLNQNDDFMNGYWFSSFMLMLHYAFYVRWA